MLESLGPIDISCDAPPYYIVQASERIGFYAPGDVRWCRLSHFFQAQTGWRELLLYPSMKSFWGVSVPEATCSCGQKLPELERYTFTLSTGQESSYFLGQCEKCKTMFWEDPDRND
jgi:hypothetical protein